MSTDWAKMRDAWVKGSIEKGKREMPEICCGKCEHFRQSANSAAGDGWCTVRKEGEANMPVFDNTDASKCPHYKEMKRIRTDTMEGMYDTHFRPQRQFDEK